MAWRFLKARRGFRFLSASVWISMIGLSLGVTALLLSFAVITGFEKEYRDIVQKFNAHLVFSEADLTGDSFRQWLHEAPPAFQQEVSQWAPFLYREGIIILGSQKSSEGELGASSSRGGQTRGVVMKGVDRATYPALLSMKTLPWPGNEICPAGVPTLLIGKKLYEEWGQPKSPWAKLLIPKEEQGKKSLSQNLPQFCLSGLFETGMYDYDASFVLMDLKEAQKLLNPKTSAATLATIDGIELWLKDADTVESWADHFRGGRFDVMSWREMNETLFRSLEVERWIFFSLMLVLILVASLNLMATVIMLILERYHDIAILRAVGLSWRRLYGIFLLAGFVLCTGGIALGASVGGGLIVLLHYWQPWVISGEVYFIDHIPVLWRWKDFGLVVATVYAVGIGACLLALKGLRETPILASLSSTRGA